MVSAGRVARQLNAIVFLSCSITGFTFFGCNNSSSNNTNVKNYLTEEQFSANGFLDSVWRKREITKGLGILINWLYLRIMVGLWPIG